MTIHKHRGLCSFDSRVGVGHTLGCALPRQVSPGLLAGNEAQGDQIAGVVGLPRCGKRRVCASVPRGASPCASRLASRVARRTWDDARGAWALALSRDGTRNGIRFGGTRARGGVGRRCRECIGGPRPRAGRRSTDCSLTDRPDPGRARTLTRSGYAQQLRGLHSW